eukprot:c19351_g1_i1 orf=263-1417(+)
MTIGGARPAPARESALWEIFPKDAELIESLWRALPEDLVEKILGWLPVTSKLRFKSACKNWNSLLSSDSYLKYQSNHSQNGWFLLCTTGEVACAFDPSRNRWHKILKPVAPGKSVIAAGGGLLCLGNEVSECRVLSVWDPLVKMLTVLPKMPRVGLIHKATMVVERATNAYVIVVTGEDGTISRNPHVYTLLTEVYDSFTGCWKTAGNPSPDAKFGSNPGVWCNGLFYCITELPYGLIVFDIRSGIWNELQVQMPECIFSPSLLNFGGQVLMAGLEVHGTRRRPSIRSIKIWKLDSEGMEWEVLQEMPQTILTEFLRTVSPFSPLVCAGVGSLLCITTHNTSRPVIFDMCTKSWRWMPSDPVFPKNRNFHLLGFCFQPFPQQVP